MFAAPGVERAPGDVFVFTALIYSQASATIGEGSVAVPTAWLLNQRKS